MNITKRCESVLKIMEARNLEGILVTSLDMRKYLSGFTGSNGWLFFSKDKKALITDGRYWAQTAQQSPDFELIRYESKNDPRLSTAMARWLKENGWTGRLGFEGCHFSYDAFLSAQRDFAPGEKGSAVTEMVSLESSLEDLRLIKTPFEMEAIQKAAEVADNAWKIALRSFALGVTEADFCAELEYQMQKCGARKPSFDTIVASGPNGAYPHASVTNRKIQAGELVTVDFGCIVGDYCSDITRTIWLGKLDEKSQELFTIVKKAHDEALQNTRPGMKGCQSDKIARDIIEKAGYGPAFSHSLGHGVGLAVHEGPGLRMESQTVLEPGMTVTIEPGIYVPGIGGCRVEDLCKVTDEGLEPLSRSPYQGLDETHPLASFY